MKKNRIIYSLMIALLLVLYLWTAQTAALLLLGVLLLVALVMFVVVYGSANGASVQLNLPASCVAGQPAHATLSITRPIFRIPLGRFNLQLACSNPVFRSTWTEDLSIETSWARVTTYELDLQLPDYGRTDFELVRCSFAGMLGLFSAPVSGSFKQSLYVNPSSVQVMAEMSRRPRASYMGETFSEMKRGTDVSEVFDVREYEPGDPLQSIHWKLSSKYDSLVAREFSSPTNYEILVATDIGLRQNGQDVDHRLLNEAAAVALSLSGALLHESVRHNIALARDWDLDLYGVDSTESLGEIEQAAMETPLRQEHESFSRLFSLKQLYRTFTKLVLITNFYDEQSWDLLAKDIDLTVVVVSQGSIMSTNDQGYSLVALDVEGLGNHVHRIDI